VVIFTPGQLYPRETIQVPIKKEAGWTPEAVLTFEEEKNLFTLP
jgi:hypothetical protein